MISKFKYELLLLLIAIIWAFFFAFSIQLKPSFSFIGDDGSYLLAAKDLYFRHMASDCRPLFISMIIGLPFLFGFSDDVVINWGIFVNFLCWFGSVILVFKIIAAYWNRQKAFVSALFFIACVSNLAIAFNLLSEALFVFLVLAVFYSITRYLKSKEYNYLTLAIAIAFLAVLVKPMAMGLVGLLILCHMRKIKAMVCNRYIVLVVISFSMLMYQMASMKKHYGDFTISYIDSFTYYNYLGARADCLKKGIEYMPGKNERFRYFVSINSHEQRKVANQDMIDQLQNNKLNLLQAYNTCVWLNATKGNSIVHAAQNTNQTIYFEAFHFLFKAITKVQNILFTLAGVGFALFCLYRRKQHDAFTLMLSVMILYIVLISGISSNEGDRFHLVFYPLVVLLITALFKNGVLKVKAK